MDRLVVPAKVMTQDDKPQNIALSQTGPGVYEARVQARDSVEWIVTVSPRSGDRALAPSVAAASREYGLEYAKLKSDGALLERIASVGNGRVLSLRDPASADIFDRSTVVPGEARTRPVSLLLILAIGVLLLDVATRRIAWDRFARDGDSVDTPGQSVASGLKSRRQRAVSDARSEHRKLSQADALDIVRNQEVEKISPVSVENTPKASAHSERGTKQSNAQPTTTAALTEARRRAREQMNIDARDQGAE
jgi:hypothetical protein